MITVLNKHNTFFLVLALAVLAFVVWTVNRDIQIQNNIRQNEGSGRAYQPSSPLAEQTTSILKTYRNDDLGFEFSYPEGVPIVDVSTGTPANPQLLLYFQFGGGFFNEEIFAVELTDAIDIEHYNDDEQNHLEELGLREQYFVTLAGEKARVTTFTGDENYTYVQTVHDGKIFSFMTSPWRHETGGVSLTETILSTFKFLK